MTNDKTQMTNNFLLEIGTEEIPAKFLDLWLKSPEKLFTNTTISYQSISAMSTPRRLSLIGAFEETQKPIKDKIRGPAKNIAFDADGNITDIGKRFAEKNNIPVDNLVTEQFKNAEYVFAIKENPGVPTKKILEEVLPQIIKSLYFPKSMRWEDTGFKFPRPIRWITALWNNEIIKFSAAGITSSNISFGHRNKGNKPITVTSPLEYKSILKKNKVIVDPVMRKNIIKKQLKKIANNLNAKVIMDEDLLDEVTNLVEYPNAIPGNFDQSYLELPREVLITVMKEQQKYFSLEDNSGNLLPNFIVVGNIFGKASDTVRTGNEWVLRARLNDAKFFWDEDKKITLETRSQGLKGIIFQDKLGTVADKTERINALTIYIAQVLKLQISSQKLKDTSIICKADLLTEMVKELPTLQGVMGKEYLLAQKGENDIALAVYEHYLPKTSNDVLPETDLGAILAIADKIDNIASFFLLGMIPSGSEDPFALRRQANGIIQIIWKKNYNISLQNLIEKTVSVLKDKIYKENVEKEIKNFFNERLRNLLLQNGIKYDCLDSISSKFDNPIEDKKRAETIMKIYNEKDFHGFVTSIKRVSNILRNTSSSIEIKQELLKENSETELFQKYKEVKGNFAGQMQKNDYYLAYKELKFLQKPIDAFFDNILIMAEDKNIRQNRLNLLNNIASIFYQLADFSKIVI